jgi:hypothetical protein
VALRVDEERESVLFIGTQFSILYTFMYSPATPEEEEEEAAGRRRRYTSL